MFHSPHPVKPDIPADGDPIALAIVLVLLAIFAIWVLVSKRRKTVAAPVQAQLPATPQEAPGAAGSVKLHSVEPKTAAMLMAIVADKMGKPLNELRFLSIKEVTDDEV